MKPGLSAGVLAMVQPSIRVATPAGVSHSTLRRGRILRDRLRRPKESSASRRAIRHEHALRFKSIGSGRLYDRRGDHTPRRGFVPLLGALLGGKKPLLSQAADSASRAGRRSANRRPRPGALAGGQRPGFPQQQRPDVILDACAFGGQPGPVGDQRMPLTHGPGGGRGHRWPARAPRVVSGRAAGYTF
jgi:hypothetical protein